MTHRTPSRVLALAALLTSSLALAGNSKYVNPMVGTAATGHTFPGALLPHGGVQLSPDTGFSGWQHCSGYHYDDKAIHGFSHMHVSGCGLSDFGDILVSPYLGSLQFSPGNQDGGGYSGKFSHANEKASAGRYEVTYDNGIKTELTTTLRTGIHRYTFPKTTEANLNFEVTAQIGGQERTASSAKWVSPTVLQGSCTTKSWAAGLQTTYFYAEFSKAPTKAGIAIDNKLAEGKTEASGKLPLLDAYATFDTTDGQPIVVRIGISSVDAEGAKKNLEAEATHWDFDKYAADAAAAWDKQLASVSIEGATEAQLRTFYTAMYHLYTHPSLYDDVDGRYVVIDKPRKRGDPELTTRDIAQHPSKTGGHYFHVYSLWDTYRAAHPLYQLLEPSKNAQFVNGMLERYKVRGELPVWEAASHDNYCMIGDPGVPVVANAIINASGETKIDTSLAMKAVVDSLNAPNLGKNLPKRDQEHFLQYGFVPSDKGHESVSKTLEYAYANGAASALAKHLGDDKLAADLWKRAEGYKFVFDPNQGLMCPKTADGKFVPNYNPASLKYEPRYVTEGNSWQYNWHVMHDVDGLIGLYGSKEKALEKLLATFDPNNKIEGSQPDVSGIIGQYAHGNEPSHHVIYLFPLLGRPDLAEKYIHQVRDTLYSDGPDGISGNDDCGQTSAWYLFSAMGFYPLDPASGSYVLGIPAFPKMTLHLENGKSVTITRTKGDTRKITFNGTEIGDAKLPHKLLTNGGELSFTSPN